MPRLEFSKRTKLQRFAIAGGCCEECGRKLLYGEPEYDHDKAAEFGGDNSLENCRVLCRSCHSLKTRKRDIPLIAKSNRNLARRANVNRKRRSWGYGRKDKYRKKITGEVVER